MGRAAFAAALAVIAAALLVGSLTAKLVVVIGLLVAALVVMGWGIIETGRGEGHGRR